MKLALESRLIFLFRTSLYVELRISTGKTTTLEALIKRSGKKAVVFRTKIGEKKFLIEGFVIPGFFRDRSDYEFVRSLIEAYSSEKLFEKKGL